MFDEKKNSNHPSNRTKNEALTVARKGGNETRKALHVANEKPISSKSRQPAPINKKRKTASKEQVVVVVVPRKKPAPKPKHYNDDNDSFDGDSDDDSIGSEDSYSSQSEQELPVPVRVQLMGSTGTSSSLKQKNIHSLSRHSIRQKYASTTKLPGMGRWRKQSEDDDDDSSSSRNDDDDDSLDQVVRRRLKQQQQQSRKTKGKETARALSRNVVRRKNAKQTSARRPEFSSEEEEEESSQSEYERGQRRPGESINKKNAKSLSRNVVRRKIAKSHVARAQESSDDSEYSSTENKTRHKRQSLVNGKKAISKPARSLPTQAARKRNQQRKHQPRDSLAGENCNDNDNDNDNDDESSLEDLPDELQFEQNGTGTKPVHANTIHFSVQTMRNLVHPITKQQVEKLKQKNAKSEAKALLISSEKHAQRIMERVRKRLRTTKLPNTYFRCEDSCVENMALVNQQQQEENMRAKTLFQKLVDQKVQLEKQLEREEQKLHRTQGVAAAAEDATKGIHPLISSFLDDDDDDDGDDDRNEHQI